MAICGKVAALYRAGDDVRLDLMPAREGTLTGQRWLCIVAPTWLPPMGADVYGDGEIVLIGTEPRRYWRPDYTTLHENLDGKTGTEMDAHLRRQARARFRG